MPFLATQLRQVAPYYAGDKPLPRRLERLARDLAAREHDIATIAQRAKVSVATVHRLKQHAAVRSRITVLQERFAEQAQEDEPLARKGNRIALAGRMVRELHRQLEANEYVTTLGVSKQGNPITGFDRARVSEIRQYLSTIADELDDAHIRKGSEQLAVQVTMTTADAVTRVQALLSRTEHPATPLGTHQGVEGGMFGTVTMDKDASGSPQGIANILDAKAVEVSDDDASDGGSGV